jgi:hypothetical protein
MATSFEITETFNEPLDRLYWNLLRNLKNDQNQGISQTHWELIRAEHLLTEEQQRLRQVFGFTSAFYSGIDGGTYYASFLIQITDLSVTGAQVNICVTTPHNTEVHWLERERLEKIAKVLLELCAVPNAETDVSMIGQLKRFLARSMDKRKTDEE